MMSETMTHEGPTQEDIGQVLGQLIGDFSAASGTVLAVLGQRLGLWQALAEEAGPVEDIARRAEVSAPYAREWLRSQAAAGYVEYEPASAVFSVSPAVAAVFNAEPLAGLVSGMGAQLGVYWSELDRYERAFRTGDGISWADLPARHAEGMDLISRAVVAPALVTDWLPAVSGVVELLTRGAAVADIGCGYGAPTIAMARAFPASTFTGFDADDASVARARRAADAAGVGERVSFEVAAAAEVAGGPYDLITYIDALHDFGDPTGALARARWVLADEGTVLLVEHAGSDQLELNLDPVSRFFYAASLLVCVPNSIAEHGEPLGSIPGEPALRAAAARAGFTTVQSVGAGAPLNLLLALRR